MRSGAVSLLRTRAMMALLVMDTLTPVDILRNDSDSI